jgi:hypothetical protein
MNDTIDTDYLSASFAMLNTTGDFMHSIDSACWGDYGTLVFAFLFFVSEVMPFVQRKCSDGDKSDGVEGRRSVLEESNGLVHLVGQLVKMKQQK